MKSLFVFKTTMQTQSKLTSCYCRPLCSHHPTTESSHSTIENDTQSGFDGLGLS